jgi:lipoate-protein ligase A
MNFLDLTLPSAAENVALDEALLEAAEAAPAPVETLRLWEPSEPMIVVGRSSQVHTEVRVDACRAAGVSIIRRASGGAAIVAGPGCLMYALVLSYELRPQLRSLDAAHRFVLEQLAAAMTGLVAGVERQGTSDLAVEDRKFSGNSARCKRDFMLYHGTLLYDFPLALVGRYLAEPPRQPAYRHGRPHAAFVRNLPAEGAVLRAALRAAWDAQAPLDDWPRERVARLVAEKYSRDEWNRQH